MDAELVAIANYYPFSSYDLDAAVALNIAFLKNKLDDKSKQKLVALKTNIDEFHIHEREIYWLCHKKQSESKISNAVIENLLNQKSTLRGANTVKKIAAAFLVN
jgi:uncharacterized protein (DUF1697 family)